MTSCKLGMGRLVLLLAVGCGGEDLADEKAEHVLAERGGPGGDALFFGVRPDSRRCAAPACGGSFVRALNNEQTTCLDGSKAAECYVADLDLHGLGLSDAQVEELTRERGRVVARGTIRPSAQHEGFASMKVEEAWRGVNDTAAGATLLTTSTGVLCALAPCPTHQGLLVNQGRRLKIDPNRTGLQASPDDLQQMSRALLGEGALLSGQLSEKDVPPTGVDALFVVTQAYLRVAGPR